MATIPICKSSADIEQHEVGLLLFPFAGAGASLYRDWPPLVAGLRVGAYQLPGRENRIRDPLPASLPILATLIARELTNVSYELVLAGHCMGGLLAHQVAIEMERHNRSPQAVLLSGVQVPENGLYGAFSLEMSDDELIVQTNRSLARAAKAPVPKMLGPLATKILRSDIAMLAQYRGDGALNHTPILVTNWAYDEHVSAKHTREWAVKRGAHVHLLDGFPEQFIGSPLSVLQVLSDFLGSMPRSAYADFSVCDEYGYTATNSFGEQSARSEPKGGRG